MRSINLEGANHPCGRSTHRMGPKIAHAPSISIKEHSENIGSGWDPFMMGANNGGIFLLAWQIFVIVLHRLLWIPYPHFLQTRGVLDYTSSLFPQRLMLWVIYTQKVIGYPRLPNRRKLFGRLQGASRDDRIGMVKLMITYEYLIYEIYEIYEKLFQTVWDQVQIWCQN